VFRQPVRSNLPANIVIRPNSLPAFKNLQLLRAGKCESYANPRFDTYFSQNQGFGNTRVTLVHYIHAT
jgi:hypothetical protein